MEDLRRLREALERHDPGTMCHSDRVGNLALALARIVEPELAADPEFLVAAEFHDVGKLLVPASLLRKPAALGPPEWELIRMHPLFGAGILGQHPNLDTAAEIVATHHERWDGLGYPYGLGGLDIPLGARIIAVVDAYDAMTAGRPYQRAVSSADAMARLDEAAGTQFDMAIVIAMHRVVPIHVAA